MPQVGEIAKAKDIGLKSHGFVRWVKCPICGVERWLCYRKYKVKPLPGETQRCRSCHAQQWVAERDYKGKNHPNWRGGKVRRGSGKYWGIHQPAHHQADKDGYVMEHIVIWEEAHQQLLPKGWIIHHINGIKDDNRPKNLLAMPRRGHSPTLLVKEVQKRLREAEAELVGLKNL